MKLERCMLVNRDDGLGAVSFFARDACPLDSLLASCIASCVDLRASMGLPELRLGF